MLRKLINYQSFLKRTCSMRKIAIFVAILLFVLSTPLLADILGTDINGKPVILRSDGTWFYIKGDVNVKICHDYANDAIAQQRANLSRGCGFAGVRWHLDYNKHYKGCLMSGAQWSVRETNLRKNALNHCAKTPPPPPPGTTTIKLLNSVPNRDSKFFKHNTDNRLKMQTTRWDKVPYRMTHAFSGTIRLTPGRRAVLAGNAAGTAGWSVDNFLLIEISSGGRTRRLVVGVHEPVIMAGGVIQKIGRNSLSFGAGEIDLTPYLQAGKPVGLAVTAFDYGKVGHVSDVFLVIR